MMKVKWSDRAKNRELLEEKNAILYLVTNRRHLKLLHANMIHLNNAGVCDNMFRMSMYSCSDNIGQSKGNGRYFFIHPHQNKKINCLRFQNYKSKIFCKFYQLYRNITKNSNVFSVVNYLYKILIDLHKFINCIIKWYR